LNCTLFPLHDVSNFPVYMSFPVTTYPPFPWHYTRRFQSNYCVTRRFLYPFLQREQLKYKFNADRDNSFFNLAKETDKH